MIANRRIFASGAALAESLAQDVAGWLGAAIVKQGHATIAVSGGITPKPFLIALSMLKLDWSKVTVTLVDERQVPEDNLRSNARLVKDTLLQGEAALAQFVPLYLNPTIAQVPVFDVVILGMGSDGHTASLFPGGDHLASAIDSENQDAVIAMKAPGAGEPRLTFTLSRLLAASHIYLHIQGEDKMQVLERALAGRDALHMPVRAVLHATKPLDLYWCP